MEFSRSWYRYIPLMEFSYNNSFKSSIGMAPYEVLYGRKCRCKTREISNFLKKGKMVISIKIQNFSRSWMTKRTSPLESSREI